ncbi:hypothetical protein BS17DRAFT_812894 [Gyrodon lividus]|nr:hypothetical protein BS17DRAFT_812894 [Gyrodon lividus]
MPSLLAIQEAQIERILWEILAIPWWLTWIIAEILAVLGIASVDEALSILNQNYAQQQAVKNAQDMVRRQKQDVETRKSALQHAQSTLSYLADDVANIDARLNKFTSEWAQQHHDIVLILQAMEAASDSATKKSLITRLKLMGSSIDALLSVMTTYVQIVKGSGLFD